MQIKDKIDFSFLKSTKNTIFKIVFTILKLAIITAIIYLAFYLLSFFRLVSLTAGIPTNFFSIIFGFMLILSVLVCTLGLVKTLYFANDNSFLLTLPTSKLQVFISKMIVFFVYEFIRNMLYFFPLLIAFGLINGLAFYYFLWIVVGIVVITLFTVAIGALLSIPALFLGFIIKSHKWLEITLVAVLLAVIIYAITMLIYIIPEDLDLIGSWGTTFWEIQDFINNFTSRFFLLTDFTIAIVGSRYGVANILFNFTQIKYLLEILGAIVVILTTTFLIIKPLFFYMASKTYEYKKTNKELHIRNKEKNSFVSTVHKEVLLNLRTSNKFFNLIAIAICLPLSIFLLNKIFGAMDTRLTGTYMTLSFNILLILLISLSSNSLVAKMFSEEGESSYLIKTNPNPYVQSLTAKLFINSFIISLSILASCIIFCNFAKLDAVSTIFIILTIECLYIGHMLWSAELDIMNPQNEQYSSTGTHTNNPNENKSVLTASAISAIFTIICFFLISENASVVWYKMFAIALIYCIYRIYMYVSKIKVYYKEK